MRLPGAWQVVIPCAGPGGLLDGCLASLAAEGDPHVPVLVVDNSPSTLEVPRWVEIVRPGRNIGVAASWNLGLDRGADLTLLLSASMRISRGIDSFAWHADPRASEFGLRFLDHGWHAVVLGRELVRRVGRFDTGFWPCEYEDTDYMRRMHLAGVPWEALPEAVDPDFYGLSCVGGSIAGRLGLVPKSDAPAAYYAMKWGGVPGQETFDRPFGVD